VLGYDLGHDLLRPASPLAVHLNQTLESLDQAAQTMDELAYF
jgi:hypothetical protein